MVPNQARYQTALHLNESISYYIEISESVKCFFFHSTKNFCLKFPGEKSFRTLAFFLSNCYTEYDTCGVRSSGKRVIHNELSGTHVAQTRQGLYENTESLKFARCVPTCEKRVNTFSKCGTGGCHFLCFRKNFYGTPAKFVARFSDLCYNHQAIKESGLVVKRKISALSRRNPGFAPPAGSDMFQGRHERNARSIPGKRESK